MAERATQPMVSSALPRLRIPFSSRRKTLLQGASKIDYSTYELRGISASAGTRSGKIEINRGLQNDGGSSGDYSCF
jgi:hypothetical protein